MAERCQTCGARSPLADTVPREGEGGGSGPATPRDPIGRLARHEAAVDAARLVLYDWDVESDALAFDGACEAVLGYSADELPSDLDGWVELIHPDDRAAFLAEADGIRGSQEPFRLVYRLRRKDGREIVVRDEGRVDGAATGGIRRVIGFLADITDRAQAEAALRASERRFRAVFEQTFQLAGILDPGGTLLEVNRTALEFVGVAREEVVGRPFWETRWWAGCPERTSRLRSAISEAAAGAVVRDEAEVRGAGDAVAVVDFSIKPVRDESGAVTLLIAEGRDVSARKQAEHALASALRELQAIMDTVPDLLYTLDLDGRLVRWNRRFEEVTGLSPEELRGLSARDVFAPSDWEPAERSIGRLHAKGFGRLEARLICRGGEAVPYQFDGAPLRDASGRVIGLSGVGRDMTERLALEGALREQVRAVETINRVGRLLTSELDPEALARAITDAAVELSGARYGALLTGDGGMTLGSAIRGPGHAPDALSPVPMPSAGCAEGLLPAFRGERIVKIDVDGSAVDPDGRRDEGAPSPPSSWMAVPLVSRSGAALGALLLGHDRPGAFDDRAECLVAGMAAQAAIALENARLVAGMERSGAELQAAYDATIEGWARALDLRDHETQGHSRRVTEMTVRLARALGVPEAELVHVRRGALLHDIGKMGVPDRILNKPGPLDPAEREAMQRHPEYALEMLAPIPFLAPVLDIPYCHHERWDGLGYPRGLKGGEIPLPARIFAVVDVWDALSHDRPYRRAWDAARVRDHIRSLSGTHFDPAVASAFLDLIGEGRGGDRPEPKGEGANGPMPAPGAGDAGQGPEATRPGPDDEVALLSAIIAVQAEIAAAGLDLDAVLRLVVGHTERLTGAAGAAVEMIDGDEMVFRAASGRAALCLGLRLSVDASLSGRCVRLGQVLRCDDAETDPRVDRPACRRVGLRSMVVAPLHHGSRPVGVLKVFSPEPGRFGDRDVRTLQLMAGLIGSAMGQAADAEARQRLLAERTEALKALRESERRLADQLSLARRLNEELEARRAELTRANARLERMAATDALTGLANRRQFDAALEDMYDRARRSGTALSIILADVDRFKGYNDEFGHPAGDEVLRLVAAALRGGVRERDVVARYGGEEFAVILPGADAGESTAVAERLRASLRSTPWPMRPVTASFGVATLDADCPGPWALAGGADRALYRSKHLGRDRVTHRDEAPQPAPMPHDQPPGTPTPQSAYL